MNRDVYFPVDFFVAVRTGRKQTNKKKELHPATSTPLKLAVHPDTSEVFYCSVYMECTESGFLQLSLTNLAAPLNKQRRLDRLCH